MTTSVVLGGGCFWCLEAAYQQIKGITKVVPGYAGGTKENPTYYDLHDNGTGHAEVVRIDFDPKVISFDKILDIFWAIHDPTTKDRQGNDVGPQYRSIILYQGDEQKQIAKTSIQKAQKLWSNPVVTELKPLDTFYEAEAEHHNYFEKHPNQAYCQIVINPKLKKLQQKFAELLK